MDVVTEVRGPQWCVPGLGQRGGRYPLAVEASVMSMVDTLMPGVSTLTRFARYYALYWAVADAARERGLDADGCRTLLRRAEVALAVVSLRHDEQQRHQAHGVDRVRTLMGKGATALAELGSGSYSPRPWGFWSQYNGPSAALGTVAVEEGALRPGRHAPPESVRRMFRPLLEAASRHDLGPDAAADLAALALSRPDTPDLAPLRDLFTATRRGRHEAAEWTGDDHTRRATLRILARAVQLRPDAGSWTGALRESVAHGDAVRSDPVLTTEQRALAWRGVLLRHHSVGAWRYLWASLVDEVRTAGGSATRADLHAWISAAVPATTVRSFLADCPATTDAAGDPRPAEQEVIDGRPPLESDLAVLLMGGRRLDELTGRALAGFLGRGSRGRGQFLDPRWVAFRHREHHDRPLAERARAFVDDMLAQSRRVALRKLRVEANGRMTLFTRLHERNGRYFADEPEGSDNVGLRIPQLGFLAEQLGLLVDGPEEMAVTPLGAELLELHS